MSDERNPYIDKSGKPLMRSSVVAYMDIIGYKQIITKAGERDESQDFLDHLHATLKTAVDYLHDPLGEKYKIFKSPLLIKDTRKFTTFTDNIVIGYPIEGEDGESELSSIFSDVADFQLTLAKAGLFVRGAIAIGELYIDSWP